MTHKIKILIKERISGFLFIAVLLAAAPFYQACTSCKKEVAPVIDKEQISDRLYRLRKDEDSLNILLDQYIKDDNPTGTMLTYRFLGNFHRENARYSLAIANHQEEHRYALRVNDTIEIVQALNNIGTDFRRIGALSEASDYHYRALEIAEDYSGLKTPRGMKNRVISLNGIGNINLTLGHFDDAKEYFFEALKDEITLNSNIGQAINYANIGSIYEQAGNYDSARIYYQYSLEQNRLAKSDMGIGLCYIHFGDLYKNEKKYDLAKDEYKKAFELMENISDRWHWLEACISIAEIHLLMDNTEKFNKYIGLAENTANDIKSPEHLSKIYNLKHNFFLNHGNYQSALSYYKLGVAMQDSVQGIKKNSQFFDIRVNYERKKYDRSIQQLEAENQARHERRQLMIHIMLLASLGGFTITGLLYYAYLQRTRSNRMLQQLEKTRTDFFTGITHEFRTPLTVILGLAERIRNRSNSDSADAKGIVYQSNILLNLVNQLLDMAKVKSLNEKSTWAHGNGIAYIEMILESFRTYASSKGVDLIFANEERSIYFDFIPKYFDKIIVNLLSNALKYTPRGGKIIISAFQNKDSVKFTVSDSGPGINPSDLPHIFEEFYQGVNRGATEAGTGIGLALVKRLTEVMNGDIRVQNRAEGGAEFILTIPLKQKFEVNEKWDVTERKEPPPLPVNIIEAPEVPDSAKNDADEATGGENGKPSILIVEDNAYIQHYIGSLLEDKYSVRFASNGEEGISKAKDFMPDLIITDLMMPVMDGYALCKAIRSNEILNHIPIIIITAKTTDDDRNRALEAGADAYMHKPFSTAELNIRVDKLLEQRQLLHEKYSKALIEGAPANIELSPADREFLNRIVATVHERIADKELNADAVSDIMCMSRSQLNRKVKQITGYSISVFILHIRLGKARRMLATDERPIGEIAMLCGFEDSNYFSRIFRQIYNITPTQFRKNPVLN